MRRRRILSWALAGVALAMAGTLAPQAKPADRSKPGCTTIAVGASEKRCIAPGSGTAEWFRDCPGCPEMVVVPAGAFTMGSPVSEHARSHLETQKQVKIARSFAVGRFAVTFDEWEACLADGGCNRHIPGDEGWGRGRLPVIHVSWDDAVAYTQWLSRRTARTYRLLTSAEREYVARAGTRTVYWMADTITLDQANMDAPIPSQKIPGLDHSHLAKVRHRTMPVDSFAPNPWGLYNVHGNVWEWTSDCPVAQGPVEFGRSSRKVDLNCGQRISRGGSWNDFETEARSAAFVGFAASSRNWTQGFRVARSL